jgi:hypothetical protein
MLEADCHCTPQEKESLKVAAVRFALALNTISQSIAQTLEMSTTDSEDKQKLAKCRCLGASNSAHLKMLLYHTGGSISKHVDAPVMFTIGIQDIQGGLMVEDRKKRAILLQCHIVRIYL